MRTRITAGQWRGKALTMYRGVPHIVFSPLRRVPLDHTTVEQVEILYVHWRPGAVNGWTRGLAGSLLGRTMQLSAIRSAHRIPTFYCRIRFHDGTLSVAALSDAMLHALALDPGLSPCHRDAM